jgi:hypothetical protein
MPYLLGGKGSLDQALFVDVFINHAPGLKEYILITMGYHFNGLVTTINGESRSDFCEMNLHHIVAVSAYAGAYILNLWELGAIIMFLHDIADISSNLVKPLP